MPRIINYPEDLGTDPSYQHAVLFMINVRAGGGGGPQVDGTAVTDIPVPGGGVVGQVFAAGGAGLQAAYPDIGVLSTNNQLFRLDTAIGLHIEEPPEVIYSAKYNNTELGSLGHLAEILASSASVNSDGHKASHAAAIAMRLAGSAGKITGNPGELTALTKVRVNPFKTSYFDQMDFRRFRFNYRFMPKTQAEALAVKAIIDLFKFHMHPRLAAGTAFMIHPNEFDIMYFYGGVENRYWHKISSCYLINLMARYGGEEFVSFPQGIPSEVNLVLEFQETEALTQERILQGY